MNTYRQFAVIVSAKLPYFINWLEVTFHSFLIPVLMDDGKAFVVKYVRGFVEGPGEFHYFSFMGKEYLKGDLNPSSYASFDQNDENVQKLGLLEIRELGEEKFQVIGLAHVKPFSGILNSLYTEILKFWETIQIDQSLQEKAASTLEIDALQKESDNAALSTQAKTEQPWEKIDAHYSDRTIVEMWWGGYTAKEIAGKVKLSSERVTNLISELRKKYGKKIVPYDKDRRELLLRKRDIT